MCLGVRMLKKKLVPIVSFAPGACARSGLEVAPQRSPWPNRRGLCFFSARPSPSPPDSALPHHQPRGRQGMSGECRRLIRGDEPATRPPAVGWRRGEPRNHSRCGAAEGFSGPATNAANYFASVSRAR